MPELWELMRFMGIHTPDTREQAALRKRFEIDLEQERGPEYLEQNAELLNAQWEWLKDFGLV